MFKNGIEALNYIREYNFKSTIQCVTDSIGEYMKANSKPEAFNPIDHVDTLRDLISLIEKLPRKHQKILKLYICNGLDGEGGALAYIRNKFPKLKTVEMRLNCFLTYLADYEELLIKGGYIDKYEKVISMPANA